VREYEFTFVVQPELSDEGVDAISTRFEGVLSQHGSEKLYYEDWGRRRLAYEIKNFQKGHYRVLHFLSDGQVIPELERAARLDDSVLRFLTVLVEEDVDDADDRRAEAVKLEEERVKRAAERAEREAEEAARAAEDAANRAANDEARDDDDDSCDDNGSRDDDDGDDGDDEKEE
jgi:small subunit ribosomal protein S6